jgi:hypothetical protein
MGPSIESTDTRRRNRENDGQVLPSGRTIGIAVRIRNMGIVEEDESVTLGNGV